MSIPNCFKVREVEKFETLAFKALSKGEATPEQQRVVIAVIVKGFARAHDTLFIPGAADETAFLNGRAFVGSQILKRIHVPVGQLHDEKVIDNE